MVVFLNEWDKEVTTKYKSAMTFYVVYYFFKLDCNFFPLISNLTVNFLGRVVSAKAAQQESKS